MESRWIKPEEAKSWIVLDAPGRALGRFHSTSEMSRPVVLGLMSSMLPEVTGLQLVSWRWSTVEQRIEAEKFRPFTPLMCAKAGIRFQPEPPPPPKSPIEIVAGLPPHQPAPSIVERWANRLQRRHGQADRAEPMPIGRAKAAGGFQ